MKHTSGKQRSHWLRGSLLALDAFLLCIALVIAFLDLLDVRVRKTIDQNYTYNITGATLQLDGISNGSISIVPGTTGKVTITGTLTEGIRKTQLVSSQTGDTLHIRQTGCNGNINLGWFGSCIFHLTIAVPATTTIRTANTNVDLSIQGVNGSHHLQVNNGNVSLSGMHAPALWIGADNANITLSDVQSGSTLYAQTNNGKISLTNVHAASYSIRADNADVTLAGVQADGALQVRTSNGKIRFDHVTATTLTSTVSNGDTTAVALQASAITATSSNGNVAFQLSAAPNAFVAHNDNGDVTIRLPHTATAYKTYVRSNNGDATENIKTDPDNTRNTITATSNNGNVTVSY